MPKTNDGPKLTKRQQEILQLIQSHIAAQGSPPTRAEIAKQMGFRSPNAAEDHLRALARKGVIELVSGTSRGIRLGNQPVAIPMIKLASLYPKALLSPEYIQGTYSLDPRFFKPGADFLVLITERSSRFEPGDYLAIHQTPHASKGHIVLLRENQHLRLEPFSDHLATELAHHRVFLEGKVVGLIRDAGNLALSV